jgi:hypothetical protein
MFDSRIARAATMATLMSMACLSAEAQITIAGTPPATATVGREYSFTPVVRDANGNAVEFNYVGRPPWSPFDRHTGSIIGTPTSPGTYPNIQIQAWDGQHFAVTAPFTITVLPAGAAPPAENAASATVSWAKPSLNTDGSPLTNLAGYVVRYGTTATALDTQVQVTSPNVTSLEINHLAPGNWYFEVAAVTAAEIQGRFSPVITDAVP